MALRTRHYDKNYRPFTAICDNHFGRKVIITTAESITAENVVDELNKALSIHSQNAEEIDYLDRYYRGDQPVLYRQKKVRPEVNHKVVVNLAKKAVDTHTAEMAGEPIQYVLRGTDEEKSKLIAELNKMMDGEDKEYSDIELVRWRSICGTSYRFIGIGDKKEKLLDESPFYLSVEDPRATFVAYYYGDRPAFSCQIRLDSDNNILYWVYTPELYFVIQKGQIIRSGINGNKAIPVVEYPNNARRLSDIEITIGITDEINQMTSDRGNGIEQFVSAWIKFINCEIDEEEFRKMRDEGALVVKSNNGAENKADVDVITNELSQSETQVAMSDLFEKFLIVQGMANRQANGGADTGSAVELRNGHYDAEQMAELGEPILKRAERQTLRIVLHRLQVERGEDKFTLVPSDIEIKISRSKSDNMLTKAECLQILLNCGIAPERAIKTVGLFSDPEQVAVESTKRMSVLYPTEPTDVVEPKNTTDDDGKGLENG